MKTILIAHNFSTVSIASMSYELAYFLARKGMRVIFISHKPYFKKPELIIEGAGSIKLYSWPTQNRPTSFADARWYYKIHRTYKPDVVIGHFVGANITAMVSKLVSLWQTKTLVYYHTVSGAITADVTLDKQKIKKKRTRKKWFYKLFTDVIIAPSQLAKEDMFSVFKISECIVVPNAIPDRYVADEVPKDEIVISYLGRISPTKGVLEMVTAFNSYQAEVPSSKLRLKLAGSGALEIQLTTLCLKNKNVRFVGGITYDAVDIFLRSSQYSIIPSKFDNLPTAGIEALMNNIPLLISQNTGLTKYMTHKKNSFIFTPEIEAMKSLFAEIETFSNRDLMAKEARAVFDAHFSIQNYCDSILKLL